MKLYDYTYPLLLLFLFAVFVCKGNSLFGYSPQEKNAEEEIEAVQYIYVSPYAELSYYDHHFREAADSINYDWTLIAAIAFTESRFDSTARSSAGATGVMQLMPATFEWACGKTGIPYNKDNITNPEMNIQCGVYYLSFCYDQFLIWDTVYAAYNAGHSQVRKWLSDETLSKNGRLTDIPFAETKAYVSRVSQAREKYIKLMEVDTNE